ERQPDGVDALDRPERHEQREARREREPERRERGDGQGDEQHPPVPDEVARLREDRYEDRGQHQLRGLEPVDVRVADAEQAGGGGAAKGRRQDGFVITAEYTIPGLFVRDHVVPVPLDWSAPDGDTIEVFAREVVSPAKRHEELPLICFLQGGPGGKGPRPTDA